MNMLFSQEDERFSILDIADGLSHNMVNCIIQDSYGFMWFGTEYGLNKYNGYDFIIYTCDPNDSASLGSNNVLDIIEDSSKTLWVCTGNTISRLDKNKRRTGKFVNYRCPSACDLENDELSADSMLWVASKNGLKHFNKKNGIFKSLQMKSGKLNVLDSLSISKIMQASDGQVWVGTSCSGLFRFNPRLIGRKEPEHFPKVSYNKSQNRYYSISDLYEDSYGNIWVASNGGGIIKIPKDTLNDQNFIYYNKTAFPDYKIECNYFMNSIIEDKNGNILFSSDGNGIMVYNPKDESFHFIKYNPHKSLSIKSNRITATFVDNTGRLWVGTHGSGVYKSINNIPYFQFYPIRLQNGNLLNEIYADIWSIKKSKTENQYWIGMNQALCSYYRIGGGFSKQSEYTFKDEMGHLVNNLQIRDIYEDEQDRLWIATIGLGLIRLNTATGKYKIWRERRIAKPDLPSNSIYCLEQQGDCLWLGVNDGQLTSVNLITNRFKEYSFKVGSDESVFITDIQKSRFIPNVIWLGEWNYGLLAFNTQTHRFFFLDRQSEASLGMNQNAITTIFEDSSGVLWLGTYGSGLLKCTINYNLADSLNPLKASFKAYKKEDGLADEMIYGILEDDFGFLWIATNSGISRFNRQTESFINFSKEDGFPARGFNLGARLKDDNNLYFGSYNGLYVFKPLLEKMDKKVDIRLTGFKKFGIEDKSVLLDEVSQIELNHNDNFISLEFTALSYNNPDKNQYAYMLKGFDKGWVRNGKNRTAVYTNLEPGNYIFKVKLLDGYRNWNENSLNVPICVRPPFWDTWWFYFTLIVFLSFIIWMGHLYLLNRAFRIREKLQSELARNFHDDTGGYIASIRAICYNMTNTASKDKERLVKQLIDQSDNLSGSIKDLLFELNPGKSSLTSLIIHLKDYSDVLFDNTAIAFKIEGLQQSFEKIHIPSNWRTNLIRIFKEGLNNIVKHCVGCETVILRVVLKKNMLILSLQDDGCGFDPSQEQNGNGLKNISKRAADLAGEIAIRSSPGEGTELVFKGKLSKNYPNG